MFVSQLKFIPALLLAAALLGAGAGSLPGRAPLATAPRAPRQALSREAPKKPAEAKPAAKARQAALAKALEVAREIDTRETSPEVKIFLLCRVAQAQLQAGGTKAALETLGLASPLVKGVKSLIVRSTCFAQVGAGQASAGDIKAARKTLADLEKLREATTDQNVLLNSGFGRDGLLGAIAAAEARAGDDKAALKAARDIEDVHRQVAALRGVARAQAARKNFAGATETVALAESTRAAEMYMDIALIQEKTDKAGAEKTWKRALASLTKLELNKDDLRQHNLRALLPALAERGHAEALRKWADGLSPPEVQVEVLLILARGG